MRQKFLVLYVPVLHQGYMELFKRVSSDVQVVYLFGEELITEFTYLEKEIRAIEPEFMARLISASGFFKEVRILTPANLGEIRGSSIITASEGISRRLAEKYLSGCEVVFEDIFLRWDESHVDSKSPVDFERVSTDAFDVKMMSLARREAQKSSCWWRHVGAILIKDRQIILTSFNQHLPSEHTPYVLGDIRDFIESGGHSDVSSAIHAEKAMISSAAKRGIALEGADLYVSTFPCSGCAQMVAFSGIRRCFFGGGHANFNGEKILRFFGVELIFVE